MKVKKMSYEVRKLIDTKPLRNFSMLMLHSGFVTKYKIVIIALLGQRSINSKHWGTGQGYTETTKNY